MTTPLQKKQYINDNYLLYTDDELAIKLNSGKHYIKTIRQTLGLFRSPNRNDLLRDEEKLFITQSFGVLSISDISKQLKRSKPTIRLFVKKSSLEDTVLVEMRSLIKFCEDPCVPTRLKIPAKERLKQLSEIPKVNHWGIQMIKDINK